MRKILLSIIHETGLTPSSDQTELETKNFKRVVLLLENIKQIHFSECFLVIFMVLLKNPKIQTLLPFQMIAFQV